MKVEYGFNPHPSRRTGATGNSFHRLSMCPVSILTRPEGRVQLDASRPLESVVSVSILTRPEGRVQPFPNQRQLHFGAGFNPHPSRRTGATMWSQIEESGDQEFQSSPVPKDGCNRVPNAGRTHRKSFNPHPSRRTGATH